MNTLSNVLQLGRFYWRTEKKMYLRLFLTFFAIFLVKIAVIDFIFMHLNAEVYNFSHTAIHAYIYTGGITITLSYLFNAIHHKQRAISYLSLPASNGEKFISRFLLGIVGVPLLVNAGILAASGIVTLFLGLLDALAGNQPEWSRIFSYYVPFGFTYFQDVLAGTLPFKWFLDYCVWNSIFVLTLLSSFVWFGTAFRQAGWVYAYIANFVLLALLVAIIDIFEIGNQPKPPFLLPTIKCGSILLTILFTYLAYRSFCRAQIVTHKFVTL